MVRLLLHSLCKHIHGPSVSSSNRLHWLGVRWRGARRLSASNPLDRRTCSSNPVCHISVPTQQSPLLPQSQGIAGDKTQNLSGQIIQICRLGFSNAVLRPSSHRSLPGRLWWPESTSICIISALCPPSFVPVQHQICVRGQHEA